MVKVIITAPRGQMDSLIVQEAYKNKDIDIVGCVGPKGAEYIGRDAGLVCGLGHEIGTLVYDNLEEIIGKCDVVIDFSRVEYSMQVLDVCLRHGKALICGTTGFTEAQTAELFAAGDKILSLIHIYFRHGLNEKLYLPYSCPVPHLSYPRPVPVLFRLERQSLFHCAFL